ncbi:MAG: cytochrome-c peroxidase [gamma proteobacterium symbiont of Bathyaustriella thionipta]|nr:cytochrome-c peroxidase [gamma proteobacterium symbiont of Bathyaustriella thionipta]MCU7951555.1 cytochrome-c peroxidase [gamma proteobacterium symbiont of Bathyaustriella thionipta]MCU7958151.1 cytochrome-c peroxidase [gamma proteobacterium symbiont of Bathyaustriella thionipta]MCU7967813.1 cytochrome-c peroxidase [gamma proteobacterium symbiont of Bathyaustriella thionipta]
MNSPILLSFFFIIFSINSFSSEYFLASVFNKEPILPVPDIQITNPAEVALGKKLFHDPRLSGNNTISCSTCHPLNNAGVDNLPVAIGIYGNKGARNTLSVYNSALHFRQFWDGRIKTLEEQSLIPIVNPLEMGASLPQVIKKLRADPWYVEQFQMIYQSTIDKETLAKAIASFERTLLTPDSPFDRYLKGETNAIDNKTKQGYQLFKSYGCSSCHQGVAIGGNMFEKLGVVKRFYSNEHDKDYGRFEQTNVDEHKYEFKVPSLRNIELTSPYLHNGSIKTLEEVILLMGTHQLGQTIPKNDTDLIVLFLKSLTGLKNNK